MSRRGDIARMRKHMNRIGSPMAFVVKKINETQNLEIVLRSFSDKGWDDLCSSTDFCDLFPTVIVPNRPIHIATYGNTKFSNLDYKVIESCFETREDIKNVIS